MRAHVTDYGVFLLTFKQSALNTIWHQQCSYEVRREIGIDRAESLYITSRPISSVSSKRNDMRTVRWNHSGITVDFVVLGTQDNSLCFPLSQSRT